LKFLQEANAIVEKLDPAERQKTAPLVTAVLETSLRALSAPPEPKKEPKTETVTALAVSAGPSTPKALVSAGSALTGAATTIAKMAVNGLGIGIKIGDSEEDTRRAERELDRVERRAQHEERMAEMKRQHEERMTRIDERSREFDKTTNEFWVEFYRKPLTNLAAALIEYTLASARHNVAELNLKGFTSDQEVFDAAVFWMRQGIMKQPDDVKENFEVAMKNMSKAWSSMIEELHNALGAKAAAVADANATSDQPPEPLGEGVDAVGD
jgi:hypothetical protein